MVVEDTGEMFTLSTTHQQITIGSLHPYYIYHFSVSAVTVAPGPYSQPHAVRTLPDSKSTKLVCCMKVAGYSPMKWI